MTAECRELDLSISLRAAGALDAPEGARLEAHLAECPACRAEAARAAELLELARLPPPTLAEHRALAELPARVVVAATKPQVTRLRAPAALRAGRRLAAGILVAAGIAAIAIAPVVVRRQRAAPAARPVASETAQSAAPTAEGQGAPGWQEPDLDTLWQDASVVSAAWDGGSE